MSLKEVHEHEIIKIGSRRFRCAVQNTKTTRATTGTTWEDLTRKELSIASGDEEANYDDESDSVDFSDSSDDDGMVAYWLQEATEAVKLKKETSKVIKEGNGTEPKMEVVSTPTPTSDVKTNDDNFTHLLYIPFHTSNKFRKRCNTFGDQIINSNPGFEPYLTINESKIDILPLELSEFQIDMVQQLMQFGGILEQNHECKATPGKSSSYGKLRVELRGVEVFKLVDTETLNQNSSSWLKQSHRGPVYSDHVKNTKYQMSVTKGNGWVEVEGLINTVISKLIELGIANDSTLKGARFDISQMMYKLEDPRVNVMEFEDEVDIGDLQKLRKKYENYNFQHASVDQLVFAEIDKSTGRLNTIVTAEIK